MFAGDEAAEKTSVCFVPTSRFDLRHRKRQKLVFEKSSRTLPLVSYSLLSRPQDLADIVVNYSVLTVISRRISLAVGSCCYQTAAINDAKGLWLISASYCLSSGISSSNPCILGFDQDMIL